MKGFTAFFIGCTTVASLSLVDPNSARWYALALLGLLYLVSAVPRRSSKSFRRTAKPRGERGY